MCYFQSINDNQFRLFVDKTIEGTYFIFPAGGQWGSTPHHRCVQSPHSATRWRDVAQQRTFKGPDSLTDTMFERGLCKVIEGIKKTLICSIFKEHLDVMRVNVVAFFALTERIMLAVYFSYCQQIPLKDKSKQCFNQSLNTYKFPTLPVALSPKLIHSY